MGIRVEIAVGKRVINMLGIHKISKPNRSTVSSVQPNAELLKSRGRHNVLVGWLAVGRGERGANRCREGGRGGQKGCRQ